MLNMKKAAALRDLIILGRYNGESSQTSIKHLPNELLVHVLSFLDGPKPSSSVLLEEPHFDCTWALKPPLKACALVSSQWRQCALRLLYKHARFIIPEPRRIRSVLTTQIQPFCNFICAEGLQSSIVSFTLIVQDKKLASFPADSYELGNFVFFWEKLFGAIDPVELLIAAPGEAMGALTSCSVYVQHAWVFDCPCQYLLLQRPAHRKNDLRRLAKHCVVGAKNLAIAHQRLPYSAAGSYRQQSPNRCTRPLSLFEIRPWTSMLLNEGSFINAYGTSEFWLRYPVSILNDLLGITEWQQKPMMSPTIRDFSYISMFPFARHVRKLTSTFGRLDRLYVQLIPRNEIWEENIKMSQFVMEDLWTEINSSYSLLMMELLKYPISGDMRNLQIFECGDAADDQAWTHIVEYVRHHFSVVCNLPGGLVLVPS